MKKIKIGTRGSALALRQANIVAQQLGYLNPDIEIEVSTFVTKGDEILDLPLAKIGDKGLFVKELEASLLRGEIDVAVHSMKDLPSEMCEGLCLAAVPERIDPSDVLITNGILLKDLPTGVKIGSSSLRRRAQLLNFCSDYRIYDLRGNVDTRLRKLDQGEFDAIILAYAGLHRLGWTDRITEKIPIDICLPAVGQGALAIQAREGDDNVLSLLTALDHQESRVAVLAERRLLSILEGGCQVPIGALAFYESRKLVMKGVVASVDGSQLVRGTVTGDPDNFDSLGDELARHLLACGANRILQDLRLPNQ